MTLWRPPDGISWVSLTLRVFPMERPPLVSMALVVEVSEPEVAVPEIRVTSQAIRDAFVALDAVDLVFSKRAAVMKTIPKFLRGSYRNAMRLPWRKRSIPRRHVEPEDGNCSCCSPGCCCTGLPEEATFQRVSWHNGSMISVVVRGQDCWRHHVFVMNTPRLPNAGRDAVTELKMMLSRTS